MALHPNHRYRYWGIRHDKKTICATKMQKRLQVRKPVQYVLRAVFTKLLMAAFPMTAQFFYWHTFCRSQVMQNAAVFACVGIMAKTT